MATPFCGNMRSVKSMDLEIHTHNLTLVVIWAATLNHAFSCKHVITSHTAANVTWLCGQIKGKVKRGTNSSPSHWPAIVVSLFHFHVLDHVWESFYCYSA